MIPKIETRGRCGWLHWFAPVLCGITFTGLTQYGLALGLGDISHSTRLGEPLRATIGLISADKFFTAEEVKARQLPEGEARALGFDIDYSPYRIEFVSEGRGRDLSIRVVSQEKITEPYLNVVIELMWPGGVVYREYTFLLDPPGASY